MRMSETGREMNLNNNLDINLDLNETDEIKYSLSSEADVELRKRNKQFPLRTYVDLYCDHKRTVAVSP